MKTKAFMVIIAGGLLAAEASSAQALSDLQTRLAELRSDQPLRLEVEVELEHRGTAPLHWNDTRQRGTAVVVSGRHGAHVREQRWSGRSTRFSFWRSGQGDVDTEPMIDELEAADLIDPAGALARVLDDATLVSDQPATWQGQPARLLVVHPQVGAERQSGQAAPQNGPMPFFAEARIWLDESGDPLALERTGELRLGGSLAVVESQILTFRQAGGRLLVDEARQTFSSTALAVLRGRDDKRIKVIGFR